MTTHTHRTSARPDGTDMDGAELTVTQALRLLADHQRAATRTLTMIPSENILPPLARLAWLTELTGRYFFNDVEDSDDWRFPAARDAAALETRLTLPLARRLTGAAHVNVRPLSGLNAMGLVLTALGGPPGSSVLVVSPQSGGHYATADLARRFGLRPVLWDSSDPHRPDLDRLADLLAEHKPTLLYLDQSHSLVPFDVQAITRLVRRCSPGTLVHVDVSHWMGLVLGAALPNPLQQGAGSFGGSTHKTFPGPHKGLLATNDDQVAARLRAAQPHLISSHHYAATCALGLSLALFAPTARTYATTVITNARTLGAALHQRGLTPEGAAFGFSRGHQLWVRTAPHGIPAATAADRLYAAGIRTNFLTDLPRIGEPALRLGVNEATWLGLTPADMPDLADIITGAVLGDRPPHHYADQVAELRNRHPPTPLPPDLRRVAAQIYRAAFPE